MAAYLYANHLHTETPSLTDTNRHFSDGICENFADNLW